MRKKTAMAVIMVFAAVLAGCGDAGKETAAETVSQAAESEHTQAETTSGETVPEETFRAVGEEGQGAVRLELTNGTGKEIGELTVKNTDSENWSENLFSEDGRWKNGETITVFFAEELFGTEKETAPETRDSSEEGESESEISPEEGASETEIQAVGDSEDETEESGPELAVRESWDLGIVFEDGSRYMLESFPFQDMERGEIRLEEVAFVEYVSLSSGGRVSTKEQELALKVKREQEAAAESEAAAKAEAERERQEAEAAEQAKREAEAAKQARREAEAAAAAAAPAQQEEEGCLQ